LKTPGFETIFSAVPICRPNDKPVISRDFYRKLKPNAGFAAAVPKG
jgi:hypothetical protein